MKQSLRNCMIVLSLFAILSGIVSMGITMNHLQKTLVEKQDENMMQLAGVTDRNISNILRSGLADLRYSIRQAGIFQAEQIWRETGNAQELSGNLSSMLGRIGDSFIGVIAMNKGRVIAASDENYGYSYYDADRFVNNEAGLDLDYVTRFQGGRALTTLAIVVPNVSKDISYAAMFDMRELYRRLSDTSVEGGKKVLLLCQEYNLLIHEPGDYQEAETMTPTFRREAENPEIRILKEREKNHRLGADSFEGKDQNGNDILNRMAVLPSSVNRNGIFAVAVIDSYESTIHPINAAVFRVGASLFLTLFGIGLIIFIFVHLNRAEIRQKQEIELLTLKQKETQELMERTQELAHNQRLTIIGTMTASIAHEFNNLLTPIMGYSIMTLDKLPPEDTESYDNVIEIYEAARKAKAIISRLSLLSRKTAPAEIQSCEPDRIASNSLASAKPMKPANVETTLDLNCEEMKIRANEIELNQLLLNLIINSFHAIGDMEGGRVTVGTRPAAGGVEFYVRDNGPGIPKKDLPRIYDPFFTTKESGKGTGLGLAIAAQVVQNHNGKISIDTEEGKGCCFTVFIPEEKK